MRVRRARVLVAVALALPLGLAACGGEERGREAYCTQLEADQQEFSEMFQGDDPGALLEHRELLGKLADKAPDDLTDEWQTFLNAVDGLQDALDEAGVEPGDFEDGAPPKDLDAAERKSVTDAADTLASAEVVDAATGIDQHARDVCKVQLGM